jgi:hypothetical protein
LVDAEYLDNYNSEEGLIVVGGKWLEHRPYVTKSGVSIEGKSFFFGYQYVLCPQISL